MAWSDAARAAALEVRRRKGTLVTRAMDGNSGLPVQRTRSELARAMKTLRAKMRRGEFRLKKQKAIAKSQLSNYRYEARKSSAHARGGTAPELRQHGTQRVGRL